MARLRFESLGLQARITFFFAFGGLLLSTTIALATLALSRQILLDEHEELAFAEATTNALPVRQSLTPDVQPDAISDTVASLSTTEGTFPLVRWGDFWVAAASAVFGEENLPDSLRERVEAGQAARLTTTLNGRPYLVTGIPFPDREGGAYYEALSLDGVESTLRSLSIIVFGVAAASTLSATALGAWASRRTLTPLVGVREAAESLAAGELDTRLEAPADADLASLTGSFNEMAGALEDRIERDARFASEVSHELRSPLMTLAASLEVLQNVRDQLPERGRTALDLLAADISRFTQLVEDLLEISRYDVGTAALHAEPLRLAEFVRQAVAHSSRTDTTVEATDEAEATVVMADKRRIAQVIANLIDNAAKYGGGHITIDLDRVDDIVVFGIEDEGPGVESDERARIFDRFSRGSAGGSRGQDTGSGLGLALVAEHVGLHGGRVFVDDRRDGQPGARFVVAWPVGEIPEDGDERGEP